MDRQADAGDVIFMNLITMAFIVTVVIVGCLNIIEHIDEKFNENNQLKIENTQLKIDLKEQMNINSMLLNHLEKVSTKELTD